MPSTITDRLNGLTTSVAVKAPVRVATTAAITLSGLQTIDNVTLASGDRVLVKDQARAIDNGIWIASAGTWTRAADFDGTFDAVGGSQISVTSGATNARTYWRVDGYGEVVIGSDDIIFIAGLEGGELGSFSHAATYSAGTVGKALQRFICLNNPPYNASPSATAAANSAAFAAAIADLEEAGGGDIYVQEPGTYLLADTNPGAVSWDNRRCIYINTDNVAIRMSKGVILKLADGQNAHVIQVGSRTTTVLAVHNILIEGGEIDGNRANQATPDETEDHNQGIAVQSDCTKVTIRDIHIHDCMYYGIGFQRNGFIDCLVDNVTIEDVGADGIDMKDDDNTSRGNVCRAVKVRRFGLASATVDPNQAGINPRGGWFIENCEVTEFSGDKHGIRIDLLAAAAAPAFQSQIIGGYVEASSAGTTTGIMLNNPNADDCVVSGVRVQGCAIGVDSRANRNQLNSVKAVSCTTGFQIYQRNQVANCSAKSCTTGMIVREDENQIIDFQAISCTTGINFEAASANNALRFGDFSGNGTNVTDSGTNNAISQVTGIKTHSKVSGDFDIASTGEKTVTIAHGLDFTPAITDVLLSFNRSTSVTDHRIGYFNCYLADATNIYCKVMVTTASATGGALMTLVADVVAKKASRQ